MEKANCALVIMSVVKSHFRDGSSSGAGTLNQSWPAFRHYTLRAKSETPMRSCAKMSAHSPHGVSRSSASAFAPDAHKTFHGGRDNA